MQKNALEFIRSADLGDVEIIEDIEDEVRTNTIDVESLPDGLIVSNSLIDLSQLPNDDVRSGISLSMLFANRVASHSPNANDEDSWLAAYQNALVDLGFRLQGSSILQSRFKKLDVDVHEAIIPFLTIAFGGAAAAPVILALLENLGEMHKDKAWIKLFDHETRRFDVKEMHFGTAIPREHGTEIRYAVARLNIELGTTQVLFFRVNNNNANFESLTQSMSVSNSLMAVVENDLKLRLSRLTKKFIWEAVIE